MLAQTWWRIANRGRGSLELHVRVRQSNRPSRGVVDLLDQIQGGDLRVVQRLVDAVDRRRRYACALQGRQPVSGVSLAGDSLDRRQERLAVPHPLSVGGE